MSTLERLTESYYPRDESEEIWDATIGDALRRCAQEVPDRIFLVDAVPDPSRRRTWTYAEFLRDAERIARALLGRFEPGEHIGVLAANCPEFMLVQHAVGLAGMRLVALNPAYREHELRYILGQSQTAGLFHASSHRGFDLGALIGQLEPELPLLRDAVAYGEDFEPSRPPAIRRRACRTSTPATWSRSSTRRGRRGSRRARCCTTAAS